MVAPISCAGLEAKIGVQENVTRREQHWGSCLAIASGAGSSGLVGVAGLSVACREAGDAHQVSARNQAVKDVVARVVRAGSCSQYIVRGAKQSICSGSDQFNADIVKTRFAGVLFAVAIGVDPDPVADGPG